ncbi:MAG: L,D-transpeptidase [Longimicrobiales bacterium]
MRISKKRWWQMALAVGWIPVAAVVLMQTGFFRQNDLRLEVDISERQLHVIQDGEVVRSYGIAVGTSSYPTPEGSFSISKIVWNPPWVPPDSDWARDEPARAPGDPANPMAGVKIYFSEPAYFIHGTNDPQSIGSAASHGCIRMEQRDAEELAQLLMEQSGAGKDEDWYDKVIGSSTDTYVVRLPNAVGLEID